MKTFLLSFVTYFIVCSAFFLIFWSVVKKQNLNGTLIIALIIIIGISIRYSRKRDEIDYKYLSAHKTIIGKYISATEFAVHPYSFEGRRCKLYNLNVGSDSLLQSKVLQEFKRLTRNKRIKIQFAENVMPSTDVWPVIVFRDTVNINMLLANIQQYPVIINKNLVPVQPEKTTNKESGKANKGIFNKNRKDLLPIWAYLLIGLFGATGFGMVINKRPAGYLFFTFIACLVIMEYYVGVKNHLPLWKPVITTIWIVLMGGMGAKSNRQFLESHPNYK